VAVEVVPGLVYLTVARGTCPRPAWCKRRWLWLRGSQGFCATGLPSEVRGL